MCRGRVLQVKVSCAAQIKRGIVPFHVKGKAELWYRLKDLLQKQNRVEGTSLDAHTQSSLMKPIKIVFPYESLRGFR